MQTPIESLTPTTLSQELGISLPYASQLLSGARALSLSMALRIFRKTGHQLGPIKNASASEIDVLERFAGGEDTAAPPTEPPP